jgi:hypothetical protein
VCAAKNNSWRVAIARLFHPCIIFFAERIVIPGASEMKFEKMPQLFRGAGKKFDAFLFCYQAHSERSCFSSKTFTTTSFQNFQPKTECFPSLCFSGLNGDRVPHGEMGRVSLRELRAHNRQADQETGIDVFLYCGLGPSLFSGCASQSGGRKLALAANRGDDRHCERRHFFAECSSSAVPGFVALVADPKQRGSS